MVYMKDMEQQVSLTNYLGVKTSAVFLWRLVRGEVWTFGGNIGKIEFRYMNGGCVTGERPEL